MNNLVKEILSGVYDYTAEVDYLVEVVIGSSYEIDGYMITFKGNSGVDVVVDLTDNGGDEVVCQVNSGDMYTLYDDKAYQADGLINEVLMLLGKKNEKVQNFTEKLEELWDCIMDGIDIKPKKLDGIRDALWELRDDMKERDMEDEIVSQFMPMLNELYDKLWNVGKLKVSDADEVLKPWRIVESKVNLIYSKC